MKLLAFIFSLYFLGLSVMPCADGEQVSEEYVEYHQTNDDHDHNSEEDFCSPLCVCNCCRTNITLPLFLSFFSDIQPIQEFNSYYLDHQSIIYFSIWQPPKIS